MKSLLLGEPDKPHEQKIDGIGLQTTVSVGNVHQTSGG